MKKLILAIAVVLFTVIAGVSSCVHKPQTAVVPADGNFPAPVAAIFLSNCTNAGCHNQASYQNAAGLLLDSWAHLFQGDVNGAEVIAYSTAFSTLLYYVNTDSSLGVVAYSKAHLATPLTRAQYMTLYNWIAAGAPDKYGNIPFATNAASRQKIYLTNQGCDVVTVIDGASKLAMRIIPVGGSADKAPHDVVISSDGMYAYVPFYDGSGVEKISTLTDTVVGYVNLGAVVPGGSGGSWSIAIMSPSDTAFMVSGWTSPGYAVTVNTAAMQVDPKSSIDVYGGSNLLAYPHGIASNTAFDTFYAVMDYGNCLIKFSFATATNGFFYKYISLNNSAPVISSSDSVNEPDPHQIIMSPDHTRYYVTCQNTNQVCVMDAHNDSLIAAIPVGTFPQEMDISVSRNLLFVACMQDSANPVSGCLGSVSVIDMGTNQVMTTLYGYFYQPHDIAVDEQDGVLYIASRNVSVTGPPPHHATACSGGRPAWYSVYNLNTLTPVNSIQYNVSSDPYAFATRFR